MALSTGSRDTVRSAAHTALLPSLGPPSSLQWLLAAPHTAQLSCPYSEQSTLKVSWNLNP